MHVQILDSTGRAGARWVGDWTGTFSRHGPALPGTPRQRRRPRSPPQRGPAAGNPRHQRAPPPDQSRGTGHRRPGPSPCPASPPGPRRRRPAHWRRPCPSRRSQQDPGRAPHRGPPVPIELNPTLAWTSAHRGDTYRLTERYDQALASYSRAIELNPSDDDYARTASCRARTPMGRSSSIRGAMPERSALRVQSGPLGLIAPGPQPVQDLLPGPVQRPAAMPVIGGLPVPVLTRQVTPRAAGPGAEHDPVDHHPVITPAAARPRICGHHRQQPLRPASAAEHAGQSGVADDGFTGGRGNVQNNQRRSPQAARPGSGRP